MASSDDRSNRADARITSKEARLSTSSSTQADLLAVGVVSGAHGIKGQVKLRSYTANPDDILAYGALLNKEGTKRFEIRIDGGTKHGLIATFKGVKDRNAAELLKGTELFVDRATLPESDDDEFYYDDLIGLEVRDASGAVLGKVHALHDFGAGDILELTLSSTGKKEMYPFTRQNFPEINVADGFVLAELPEVLEPGGKKE